MSTIVDRTSVETAETRYGILSFLRDDDPIGLSLRRYGEWAQLEIDFVLQFLFEGATVVDVGANVGTHTLAFARAVGPEGCVHAFEPQEMIFELLRSNAETNAIDNAVLHLRAAGERAGIRYVPTIDYASHVNAGAVSLRAAPGESAGTVEVVALDDMALDDVRLIKIDVEGMEPDVIRGAAATLARCRPFLFVECNTVANGVDIIDSLAGAGYALYYKRSGAYNPANFRGDAINCFGPSREGNILCVPVELESSVRAILDDATELFPIGGIDDLALQVLRTPRYGDRGEHDRDAAWLARALERAGGHAAAPAAGEPPRNERTRLDDALYDPQAGEIRRLEYRLAKQRYEVDIAERRAAAAEAVVAAASDERAAHAELQKRFAAASRELDVQTRRAQRLAAAVDEAASAAAEREQRLQRVCNDLQDRLDTATRALNRAKTRCEQHEKALAAAQASADLADILRAIQGAAQSRQHDLEARVTSLRDGLTAASRRIEELLDRERATQSYVDGLEARALRSETDGASAQERLEDLQRRSDEVVATLAEVQRTLASRERTIHTIVSSRSWRITAPFRTLRRLAGGAGARADFAADPLANEAQ